MPGTLTLGLVEDSEADFVALSRSLRRRHPGTAVTRWHRAEDALAALTADGTDRPRVLLVDLSLPGIDGSELIGRLRELPATRSLPMLVLSGSRRQQDVDRCYAAGANTYLVKPMDAAALTELVERLYLWLDCAEFPSPA